MNKGYRDNAGQILYEKFVLCLLFIYVLLFISVRNDDKKPEE